MIRSTSRLTLAAGALLLSVACGPQNTDSDAGPAAAAEIVTVVPNYLRPPVMGSNGGVSAGHPLTTAAAMEILQNGGNAFDAGVAALLTGGVVEQDLYSLGGESLILVFPRSEGEVTSIVGQGWAARDATIEWYRERARDLYGYGLDPAVVPGALHGALTVLERWGTMSFEEVAERAIEYAELGFPLRSRTVSTIYREIDFINRWPSNRAYWTRPDGSIYASGEIIRLPTLANTLNRMVEGPNAGRAPTGGKPASPPPGTASTRATSPRRWWRSCRRTARPSRSMTSRSSTPGSRNPSARPTSAIPSTSSPSTARGRCCCKR